MNCFIQVSKTKWASLSSVSHTEGFCFGHRLTDVSTPSEGSLQEQRWWREDNSPAPWLARCLRVGSTLSVRRSRRLGLFRPRRAGRYYESLHRVLKTFSCLPEDDRCVFMKTPLPPLNTRRTKATQNECSSFFCCCWNIMMFFFLLIYIRGRQGNE